MPLTSRFVTRVKGDYTATAPTSDLTSVANAALASWDIELSTDLTSGTGAGQADLMFVDTRTIASGNDDLDLAGVLTNAFGATLTFVKVKALYIAAAAANPGNITVGAGTNPWNTLLGTTSTLVLRPGTRMIVVAGSADATGYGVTAATGDILRLAGTTVTYDIAIIGTSA